MRLKHNKKRNTAFLFETLVRELTKAIVRKDENYKKKAASIVRKHFRKGSTLQKELQLYNSLQEGQVLKPHVAEKLIFETKMQYKNLNRKEIFSKQSALINEMNKTLSGDVFSNFVPNYKDIATIYQIFNDETSPKKRVLLEDSVLNSLTNKNSKGDDNFPKVDNLVVRGFIKKFNEEYNSSLMAEQKELLQKYIFSFTNSGVEFKLFLNEELGRLKNAVKDGLKMDDIKSDSDMCRRSQEILGLMEGFKETPISTEMIEKIIKIQSLVGEIQS